MSDSPQRLVFVGAATLDSIALVEDFPAGDERMIAKDVRLAGGGPAATAAVAAARLGHDVAYVGTIGSDDEGDYVLSGLASEGVDVTPVQRTDERTGASVVLVHEHTGVRAISTRMAPPPDLADPPAANVVANADWVHVDHLGWAPVHDLLAHRARPTRPRLSVDAGNPISGFDIAGTDLYVPTLPALETTYGPGTPRTLLQAALDAGARTVVATRGSAGCVAATRDGDDLDIPGHRTDVVSTLGAGDVFHGALVAAVACGYAIDQQLRYANVVAALSCTALDGRSAIPDHPTTLATLDSNSRETE